MISCGGGSGCSFVPTWSNPPIAVFKTAVFGGMEGEIAVKDVVQDDLQSNRQAEQTVKDATGMIGTWFDMLGCRYGRAIPPGSVLAPWLFRNAG